MKVSPEFLKAKKDKNLRTMLIMRNSEHSYIRLCIDEKSKYSERSEIVLIETDTKISVDNCKPSFIVGNICFHIPHYNYSPVKTFLDSIKKDSEVSFKIIAFNGSNLLNEVNFVSHKLYGVVDSKIFLLDIFTGLNNLSSPIQ